MSSNPQTPSKGRIVLFRHKPLSDGQEWPAIVTHVHDADTIDLQVFSRNGVGAELNVGYCEMEDDTNNPAWRWPPRV